jgi:transcriptional regulator with XRE-family HTH domain
MEGMILKDRLRFLLDQRSMTAAALARKAGVSKQVISVWLGGAEPRKLDQVKKVADALGVSMDSLCFGEPGMQEAPDSMGTLFGNGGWVTGVFEVKLRRIKKRQGE